MDKRPVVILVAVFLIFAGAFLFFRHVDYSKISESVDLIIVKTLASYRIGEANLAQELHKKETKRNVEFDHISKIYYAPAKIDFKTLESAIEKSLSKSGSKILKSDYIKGKKEELTLEIYFRKFNIVTLKFIKKASPKAAPEVMLKPGVKPKVAIVLDDFGYGIKNLAELSKINYPLTLSILPNLTYSKKVAAWAKEHNFDAILHLPLEPYEDKEHMEKDTILISMDGPQVRKILKNDFESVPGIKGVSNHMGSRATENELTMQIIFSEMKKNNLFYLDSVATGKSICKDLSKKVGLKYARRDIFLDNENDSEYIKGQLKELQNKAFIEGYAVGIGHDRPLTIATLKEIMPRMQQAGIEFIYISEIVK